MLRKIQLTCLIILSYLGMMVTVACVHEQLPDLYAQCPGPSDANLIGAEIFFGPYENERYSNAADTVDIKDFFLVLEFVPERLTQLSNPESALPWETFALSCLPRYNFKNISNISVILTAPFNGLPIGTDISYLLESNEKETLAEFRDFSSMDPFLGLYLKPTPENYSQLKTRTFIFLKNGTSIQLESSSPILQTD
ncbi:hypothetical protein [Algoriphagus hitonicola]|uniref:Lipoprotein n=1 Tax=Algoriphagus hitonicola TaxID=435880 RepID=A0A1I2TWS5_9BACT|nr:hypothetical protein [Algoriphagus hitonicola]SFG68669.1 hypothetical protein SAMN04487988_106224 [Algoriphagus hitonicola]